MIVFAGLLILIIVIVLVCFAASDPSEPRRNANNERRSANNKPRQEWNDWLFTPEYKIAGIRGEAVARNAIRSVLRGDDRMFTNVSVEYDGRPAEMDFVIVNRFGVFIIEVKNYVGRIEGGENDREWNKFKTTGAGWIYEKTVRNPLVQVRRQVYVLAHWLESRGERCWVRGYAILLKNNSPVDSPLILTSTEEIDRAVHTADRNMLDRGAVERISALLSGVSSGGPSGESL